MPPRAITPTTLPPLRARNERDRNRMEAWLDAKLLDLDGLEADWRGAQLNAASAEPRSDPWTWTEAQAIAVAEQYGNMEPLRTMYPQLAKFLQPPKRPGKGKRFEKVRMLEDQTDAVTMAVWDAVRIKKIWKKYYTHRVKGYATAEEIAARRWDIATEAVHVRQRSRQLPPDSFFIHYLANGGEL
jgi:hypothetical protein